VLKVVGWGGSTLFMIILGLLVFFATRAVSTNDAEVNQLKAQLTALQAQQK
jgi:hypothetical protein